jgi:hypothetical protein
VDSVDSHSGVTRCNLISLDHPRTATDLPIIPV